jgi:hypothetical protein
MMNICLLAQNIINDNKKIPYNTVNSVNQILLNIVSNSIVMKVVFD